MEALIVDDDLTFSLALAQAVQRDGCGARTAPGLAEARLELQRATPDVLFLDLHLPDGSGLELLDELPQPRPEVVLVTGQASVETAVEALRRGVADYLTKPVDLARVKMTLAGLARTRGLRQEVDGLRGELRQLGHFGRLVGGSPPMQRVYDLLTRAAPSELTVLIVGATGTGKEEAARTLHELSRRKDGPFLAVNCGAVSPGVIESELFGHERGAFTGADRVHRGHFERAHQGTLLLDEVTEMSAELQVRLLRVLETRRLLRVGGTAEIEVDVRVLAATNRRPEEAVLAGKLREDLLYRLDVLRVELPSLHERGTDVDVLAAHFLAGLNQEHGTAKQFSRAALDRLRGHDWPGNVRELRNVVQRAFVMGDDVIGVDSLSLGGQPANQRAGSGPRVDVRVGTSFPEVERRLLLATLEHFEGDKPRAAEVLGISLKTLYNRLNAYRTV